MLGGIRQAGLSPLIAALYLVATLIVGATHAPAGASARPQDQSLAAFVLPDGTWPDLCLDRHDGSHDRDGARVCDACRLTAAPGLPGPAVMQQRPGAPWHAIAYVTPASATHGVVRTSASSARGPPATT